MKIIDQSVDAVYRPKASFDENIKICATIARLSHVGVYDPKREFNLHDQDLVDMLVRQRHDEPLEMCTIYVKAGKIEDRHLKRAIAELVNSEDTSHTHWYPNYGVLVTTLREIVEHTADKEIGNLRTFNNIGYGSKTYLEWLGEALEAGKLTQDELDCFIWSGSIDPRVQCIITTNRQIQTELTRHRSLSKNWESTRWITYKDDLVFVVPEYADKNANAPYKGEVLSAFTVIEDIYHDLLAKFNQGNKEHKHIPAFFLPSGIKCTAGYSAFYTAWKKVDLMRTTDYCGNPHKYIRELIGVLFAKISNAVVEEAKTTVQGNGTISGEASDTQIQDQNEEKIKSLEAEVKRLREMLESKNAKEEPKQLDADRCCLTCDHRGCSGLHGSMNRLECLKNNYSKYTKTDKCYNSSNAYGLLADVLADSFASGLNKQ